MEKDKVYLVHVCIYFLCFVCLPYDLYKSGIFVCFFPQHLEPCWTPSWCLINSC